MIIERLWNGFIIGALSFRNEYDGHNIDMSKEQVDRIYDLKVKYLTSDRGYQGRNGNYWSSIPNGSNNAYNLNFNSGNPSIRATRT